VKDNAYVMENGTSAATALVSGCAAILMYEGGKGHHANRVTEALLNSTTPFGESFDNFGGKLGSGILNLEAALSYITGQREKDTFFSPLRSKGTIIATYESSDHHWQINPAGGYSGFYFEPDLRGLRKPERYSVSVLAGDSLWNRYTLPDIPKQFFVATSSPGIKLEGKALKKNDILRISYQGKTIDSTILYCSGLHYIDAGNGMLEDGSGENMYANSCSCRWIIRAPAGKNLRIRFDQMDTQANVDYVYLVDGETAVPENIFAKFSGQNVPPVVYSRSNIVLVWFVTDGKVNGQGWRMFYDVVELE
jgi:serine protease